MERKTVITVEYNLDDVLEYHYPMFYGKTKKAADCLKEELPVREWYMREFADDPMGERLRQNLTWADLLERMRCGENFHEIINVCDTVVRERIFTRLAEMLLVPYEVIYQLWH